MTDTSALQYDEAALKARLLKLPGSSRALFACACAERLMPVYEWFASKSGLEGADTVGSALTLGWAGSASADRIEESRQAVEALVPSEDEEELFPGIAVAQNAVACMAYALWTRQTEDAQAAVWAARQLYDAADYLVQQGAPTHTYVEDLDSEPEIQWVLRGINSALTDLGNSDFAVLKARARADGDALLALMNGQRPT